MKCLICCSNNLKPYYYPPTQFNGRIFYYFECESCFSAQIDPLPDENDMKLMYGEEDHSYLCGKEIHTYPDTYPKYNHQKFQLDFFGRFNYAGAGKTLLDIGCGSGFYMNRAAKAGLDCVGIEFDAEFAELLRKKTGQNIFSFEEFEKYYPEKKFDIIHLGHVLEHSTAPFDFIAGIKKYSHSSSLIIVDGPLEKNKCFSRWLIKWSSKLQTKKTNTYHPQHITFTNYSSQLAFFEKAGLQKVNYVVAEQMFPFPASFKGSVKEKLLFCAGRISVTLSKLIPKAGNIFHYAGRFK